ncbi:MAG: CehA/McbA family metallohydrolase [Deltaproteobacteria bacterium]|nr:CehA/McbA family metallohydrolase [Deltaproteobacteria bacterium]
MKSTALAALAPRRLLPLALGLALGLAGAGCPGDPEPLPDPIDLTARLEAGQVQAGIVEHEDALIGGPKAEGQVGDIKLYNSHVAFIVEGVRLASGYRYWGGNLADADLIRPEGEPGRDLYGEAFFSWNLEVFQPTDIIVVSDGRESGEAHVRLTGRSVPFGFAESFRDIFDADPVDLEIAYDYRLGPDDRALHLTISLTNVGDATSNINLPLVFSSHGDGVEAYAPGPGFEDQSAVANLPYSGAVGRDLSYGLIAADDDLNPLFAYKAVSLTTQEAYNLPAGRTTTLDYDFAVSEQSAAGLELVRGDLLGYQPGALIRGTVSLPDTVADETAWVAVRDGLKVASLAPVAADGSFEVPLEPGLYEVYAFASQHLPATPVTVDLGGGGEGTASLSIDRAARVTSTVTDTSGNPVPARVTFLRQAGTGSPESPSETRAIWSWGRGVSAVAYVIDGPEEVVLPAGSYTAYATHGPSWEMDQKVVTVTEGESASISFQIEKVIDTSGWVSADFHIHAMRSPDSRVPYDIRAKQAATDDLDIPVLTEHVYVSTLQPIVDTLGLGDRVIGMVGHEVTTFSYGHFNAFPLDWRPLDPNGGAVYEHGRSPRELISAIRTQNGEADEIIQVNHPRSLGPGGYFSWIGLDAVADTTNKPDDWSLEWDSIEAFNGGCSRGGENGEAVDDWMAFTSNGYPKTLSSGSDTHDEDSPPGIPRNWIQLDKAAVAADPQAIVAAVRDRRLIVSCGPFVEFAAADGTRLGGRTGVDGSGVASFSVKVQAPSWMQLDEIRLLENGVPVTSANIAAETGVVRFEGTLEHTPAADAWYALEVLGSGSSAPMSWRGPPYALSNAIEIDADGDGSWTPPGA